MLLRRQPGGLGDTLFFAADLGLRNLKKSWGALRGRWLSKWRDTSPRSFELARQIVRRRRRLMGETPPSDVVLPPEGGTVVVDGITMRIGQPMSEMNIRRLCAGLHTLEERMLVARALEPDDIVMELGGGIGMVAIACAKAIGSERVFSFEANPRLEPLVRDNFALNDVQPTLRFCMLGPERGSRSFEVNHHFSRSSVYSSGEGEIIEIPVESFNEAVAQIKPTLLIIDIEGSEKELFDYADLSTVRKLVIEFHPDLIGLTKCVALKRRLSSLGFVERDRLDLSYFFAR